MKTTRPITRLKHTGLVILAGLLVPLADSGAQSVFTFAASEGIAIPAVGTSGPSGPYPSTVNVSGVSGTVTSVAVGLVGLDHTFPADLDIFLVSPGGLAILLLSDAGGGNALSAKNLVFQDNAPSPAPEDAALSGVQYLPTNYGDDETNPPGVVARVNTLIDSAAAGVNGIWSLYIDDDASGDLGSLDAWDIEFTVADREFLETGAMQTGRQGHTATPLWNGTILVVGGANASGTLASCEIFHPSTGTWTSAGELVAARWDHTATVLPNGKVLIAGGSTPSGAIPFCELYDPVTGNWSTAAGMNESRSNHTATLTSSGTVLVVGGTDPQTDATRNTSEIYYPNSNEWILTSGTLNTGRYEHTTTWLSDGRMVAIGGFNNTIGFLNSVEIFNPMTGTWSVSPNPLPVARDRHSATVMADGTVLVVGGRDLAGALSSAQRWDPASGTWTAEADFSYPRSHHSASLLPSGELLVAGGVSMGVTPISERFNPVTALWEPTGALTDGPLSSAREKHTATLLSGGAVLVAGGGTETQAVIYPSGAGFSTPSPSLSPARYNQGATLLADGRLLVCGGTVIGFVATNSSTIYDPTTDSWSPTLPMSLARSSHPLVLLADGTVLAPGGIVANSASATVDLFDPVNGTWTQISSMRHPKNAHTSRLLADGRVLVVGSSVSPIAEIFDPLTRSWSDTSPMVNPRFAHAAMLLEDGRVLVAGGIRLAAGNFEPITFAEIYDPGTDRWTPTGAMNSRRQIFRLAPLADGRVLATGGLNAIGIPDVEIFDPATGIWTPAAAMMQGRFGHGSLVLSDGRVAVIAGAANGNSNGSVSSVEVYDPALNVWKSLPSLFNARNDATVNLLGDGSALVVGGFQQEILDSVERYTFFPSPTANRVPELIGFQGFDQGRFRMLITHSRAGSTASSGNTRESASVSPVIQWRHLDSGRIAYLPPDTLNAIPGNWPSFTFTGTVPELPAGFAMVTPILNGIRGTSMLYSPPKLELQRVDGTPVNSGSFLPLNARPGESDELAFRLINRGGVLPPGFLFDFAGPDAGSFSFSLAPPAGMESYRDTFFVLRYTPTRDGVSSGELASLNTFPGTAPLTLSLAGEPTYSVNQIKALLPGATLIKKDEAGDFTLQIEVKRSTDLEEFFPFPMSDMSTDIVDGKLEFRFQSVDDTEFFIIETR